MNEVNQVTEAVEPATETVVVAPVVAFEDMKENDKLILFVQTCERVAADGGGQQDIADALGIEVKRVSQLRQRLTNPKGAYGLALASLPKGRKTNVNILAEAIAQVRGVETSVVMAERKTAPSEVADEAPESKAS
jgi:hypothetical protein